MSSCILFYTATMKRNVSKKSSFIAVTLNTHRHKQHLQTISNDAGLVYITFTVFSVFFPCLTILVSKTTALFPTLVLDNLKCQKGQLQ